MLFSPTYKFFLVHSSITTSDFLVSFGLILQQKLREDAIKYPELLEKTMKEGDLFSKVCGAEKNGYVRTVGLGPTPSDLELPGIRKYKSTKLQMVMEAHRLSDQKVEDLQQEMGEMRQQMAEMRQMFLASQDSQNYTPPQVIVIL